MCQRCEYLEEELAAAKRALGEVAAIGDLIAVQRWLGVTRSQSRIILRLYRARGRYLPMWMLAEELLNPDADPGAIKSQVYNMRKRLGGQDTIEAGYGDGYRLSAATSNRVRDALSAGA